MCLCNPNVRTPWCGKGDCVVPQQIGIKEAVFTLLGNIPADQLEQCNRISNNYAVTGDEALILTTVVETRYISYCIDRLEKTRDIKKVLHEYYTELYGK